MNEVEEELAIVSQPVDYIGEVGTNAVFTIGATGEGLSYQWQYQNVGSTSWRDSSQNGSRTAQMTIPITEARDGQKYRCIVTDKNGDSVISDTVKIQVGTKVIFEITSQPADFTGAVGETAVFTVEASGENLSYQWQYCNAGYSTWKNSGQTGNKTSTLSVPITAARDGQKYRCVITDGSGKSLTSNEAVLHVGSTSESEKITITDQPKDYTGAVGETAVFTVEVTGTDISYQWQYQNAGTSVWKASGQSGNKTNTLKVPITTARDGQKYRCVITDGNGISVTSNEAALHVGSTTGSEEITISGQPADYTGAVGETAVFTVEATGTNLSYQWQYQNAGTSVWKASGQSGNKTSTLNVPITAARDGQKYRCVVKDGNGNTVTSEAATLHVKP
ncbi:MAG: immunoglobulin domain-containing protein [Lachnospiraceae bacterium]|nr:immunoglobulin domain-containing protein [Lachnospiraceae bacterium]